MNNDFSREQVDNAYKRRYYNEYKISKKKKKLKILLYILVVILIAAFFASDFSRIQSISVSGNNWVDKQKIIDASGVKVAKNFTFFTDKGEIVDKVEKLPLIDKVTVTKSLFGNISIKVVETDIVARCTLDNVLYLIDEKGRIVSDEEGKLWNYALRTPVLNNFDKLHLEEFAKEYIKLPDAFIGQVSNINYSPQSADEKRCEFVMDDEKILYLRYDQMVNQLKENYYAVLMEKYPDDKYYDFLGKYVYRSK